MTKDFEMLVTFFSLSYYAAVICCTILTTLRLIFAESFLVTSVAIRSLGFIIWTMKLNKI